MESRRRTIEDGRRLMGGGFYVQFRLRTSLIHVEIRETPISIQGRMQGLMRFLRTTPPVTTAVLSTKRQFSRMVNSWLAITSCITITSHGRQSSGAPSATDVPTVS